MYKEKLILQILIFQKPGRHLTIDEQELFPEFLRRFEVAPA
jgi:hypothetical protein